MLMGDSTLHVGQMNSVELYLVDADASQKEPLPPSPSQRQSLPDHRPLRPRPSYMRPPPPPSRNRQRQSPGFGNLLSGKKVMKRILYVRCCFIPLDGPDSDFDRCRFVSCHCYKSGQIARSPLFVLLIRGHSRRFMQPTTEMIGRVATRPTVVPATVAGQ